jgi:hypothetical protein
MEHHVALRREFGNTLMLHHNQLFLDAPDTSMESYTALG